MTFSKLADDRARRCLACLCGPARAQEQFPNRLITVIAPITAGTAIDIMARLYADKLSKRFGQQVVVANRAGAGGMIGAQAVATAPPDGYTVLFANSGHAILGAHQQEPDVRSDRRFRRRLAGRRSARHRRRAALARSFEPQGVRRAGEVEARHDQLRLRRHRHLDASGRRLFRAQDRHRHRPRAVHGERDDHRRPARRAHPGLVRADGLRAAAAAGRPAQGARGRRPGAGRPTRSRSRPRSRRASITSTAPGTACWRRARRPSRCWPRSTRRWRRPARIPNCWARSAPRASSRATSGLNVRRPYPGRHGPPRSGAENHRGEALTAWRPARRPWHDRPVARRAILPQTASRRPKCPATRPTSRMASSRPSSCRSMTTCRSTRRASASTCAT